MALLVQVILGFQLIQKVQVVQEHQVFPSYPVIQQDLLGQPALPALLGQVILVVQQVLGVRMVLMAQEYLMVLMVLEDRFHLVTLLNQLVLALLLDQDFH
jgi:hypothetical protein